MERTLKIKTPRWQHLSIWGVAATAAILTALQATSANAATPMVKIFGELSCERSTTSKAISVVVGNPSATGSAIPAATISVYFMPGNIARHVARPALGALQTFRANVQPPARFESYTVYDGPGQMPVPTKSDKQLGARSCVYIEAR
jgi:hypothetical protein